MMLRSSLNLCEVPFSTYGSALTIQKIVSEAWAIPEEANGFAFYVQESKGGSFEPGYYIRALYEDDRYRLLYRLSFDGSMDGMSDVYDVQRLSLSKEEQTIDVCMPEEDSIPGMRRRVNSWPTLTPPMNLLMEMP